MSETLTELTTHAERLREEVDKVQKFAGEKIEAFLTLASMSATLVMHGPEGTYEQTIFDRGFDPRL